MATKRQPVLHDNLLGGLETTLPSHLLSIDKWRSVHNMRFTPTLEQVPKKILHSTIGSTDIRGLSIIPNILPGYGRVLIFGTTEVRTLANVVLASGLNTDSDFRLWSHLIYNGCVYYINDLNPIRCTDGATDAAVANAPSGRYVVSWFDHLVVGRPTHHGSLYQHRVQWSDLYNFTKWDPDATNEAGRYDFVEWQRIDYPYVGITGLAKLRSVLWVYTPTAIIPLRYVGKPKVVLVDEDNIFTGVGNSFPYSMVALNNVHFFYDGVERNFFAFDGAQITPIGEPIRRYIKDNLNSDPILAAKMWAFADVDNREIVWVFYSTSATTAFDRAVVFNYRTRQWMTRSVENITAFCGTSFKNKTVAELTGLVSALTGTVAQLGATGTAVPHLYGAESGKLYRDEVASDATGSLLAADDPVLESGDLLYQSLSKKKECDSISVNAFWDTTLCPVGKITVAVSARNKVDEPLAYTDVGDWKQNLEEDWLSFAAQVGKVLRYRFTLKNTRMAKFSAYEDSVEYEGAEK